LCVHSFLATRARSLHHHSTLIARLTYVFYFAPCYHQLGTNGNLFNVADEVEESCYKGIHVKAILIEIRCCFVWGHSLPPLFVLDGCTCTDTSNEQWRNVRFLFESALFSLSILMCVANSSSFSDFAIHFYWT
jgi:hypothetical protein